MAKVVLDTRTAPAYLLAEQWPTSLAALGWTLPEEVETELQKINA